MGVADSFAGATGLTRPWPKETPLSLDDRMAAQSALTVLGYNPDVKDYPYDPEKAKKMLEAAGVKTPLEIDLWYQPVTRPYNPNGKRIGEMMQADLAKLPESVIEDLEVIVQQLGTVN